MLEPGEGREPGGRIGRHDLAVKHRVAPDRERQRLHQLGIAALDLLPVAGVRSRARSSGHVGHARTPCRLGLVDPAAGGRAIGQGGQHRGDPAPAGPGSGVAPATFASSASREGLTPLLKQPRMAPRSCFASRIPLQGSPHFEPADRAVDDAPRLSASRAPCWRSAPPPSSPRTRPSGRTYMFG